MRGRCEPTLELSPKVSDEVRKTTCYMCACRCGIDVHLKDGPRQRSPISRATATTR